MELSNEELNLLLQMLQQVNFPTVEAKLVASQLQAKVEATLADRQK